MLYYYYYYYLFIFYRIATKYIILGNNIKTFINIKVWPHEHVLHFTNIYLAGFFYLLQCLLIIVVVKFREIDFMKNFVKLISRKKQLYVHKVRLYNKKNAEYSAD